MKLNQIEPFSCLTYATASILPQFGNRGIDLFESVLEVLIIDRARVVSNILDEVSQLIQLLSVHRDSLLHEIVALGAICNKEMNYTLYWILVKILHYKMQSF